MVVQQVPHGFTGTYVRRMYINIFTQLPITTVLDCAVVTSKKSKFSMITHIGGPLDIIFRTRKMRLSLLRCSSSMID